MCTYNHAKGLKKFSAVVTTVIRKWPLLNMAYFGLVEKRLKMISAFLLFPLYFCFTILTELTCQKCPCGSPPYATLGDNICQETSVDVLQLGSFSWSLELYSFHSAFWRIAPPSWTPTYHHGIPGKLKPPSRGRDNSFCMGQSHALHCFLGIWLRSFHPCERRISDNSA